MPITESKSLDNSKQLLPTAQPTSNAFLGLVFFVFVYI